MAKRKRSVSDGSGGMNQLFRSSLFRKSKKLRWYACDLVWGDVPSIPCCYVFLNRAGKAIYVGSTHNLNLRLAQHRRVIQLSAAAYIVKYRPSKKFGDWLMLEARLIRRLRPILNKQVIGGRANA